jgi:nicotinamidase-related amidase
MEPTHVPDNEALLVMDIQNATVKMLKDSTALTDSLTKAIQTARRKKIPVIYGVIGFRKGYPEVNPNNKSFSNLKKNATLALDTEWAVQIHPSFAPEPGEIIVTKKRVSTFTGSDLEVVLRSLQIKRLVLSGISTSGVVLSTIREAADKDYEITVLSDCCADLDDEVHRVLTTKIFPRQADVMTSEEWSHLHP